VRGRSSISFGEIIQYDLEYVKNMSLTQDITILLMTVGVILRGVGAR
jgi:lipopolysaccharide/colanic/teichoic acid biosynthesis glycosyltransferase